VRNITHVTQQIWGSLLLSWSPYTHITGCVGMISVLSWHDENVINTILLHKTRHYKEHTTLAIFHIEVWHTTVFLKQRWLIISCPNVSVHVWACTVWLSVSGLTCLLPLLWLSFHAHTMLKIQWSASTIFKTYW